MPGDELFGDAVLTVGELTTRVKSALRDAFPRRIAVRGETSNVTLHRGGNIYFSLKDEGATLSAVMWKSAAAKLPFTPTDGMDVVATGEVDVYAGFGRYQLKTLTLEPVGVGALDAAFRQLRDKLTAEGLFDASRKRPIPAYPRVVVAVTSPQAAGFQDVLKVLDRFGHIRKLVYPVAVQGKSAAGQIAEALAALSGVAHYVDAVLLGRGGGSLEDLWAFNEEEVARAVVACRVPVVTGIGHETDTTLADLAADHHAHTPTAAAEFLTRAWATAPDEVDFAGTRLRTAARRFVDDRRTQLGPILRHRVLRRPTDIVDERRQRVDATETQVLTSIRERLRLAGRRVADLRTRLEQAHPRNRLARQREQLASQREALREALRRRLRDAGRHVEASARALARHDPSVTLQLHQRTVTQLRVQLDAALRRELRLRGERIAGLRARATAVDPDAVLRRGFTLTFDEAGNLVRTAAAARAAGSLVTRFADGEVRSAVSEKVDGRRG
ncbi:MAG: exodeoxyribonuclease VII large subunit [Planctomycetota bacterium]